MRCSRLLISLLPLVLLTPYLLVGKPLIPEREYVIRFGYLGLDKPVSVRSGPDGELYVYGLTEAFKYELQRQAFMVRVDKGLSWQLIFGSKFSEEPVDMYVSMGKVYLFGNVEGSCSYPYMMVVSRDGKVELAKKVGDCTKVTGVHVYAGQIYLAGVIKGKGFVTRVNEKRVVWTKLLDFTPSVVRYSMGYVYVSGTVDGKLHLVKLTADIGKVMWAVRVGANYELEVKDVEPADGVYLVGSYKGVHGLLIKLTRLGSLEWAKYLESSGEIRAARKSGLLKVMGKSVDGKCWLAQFEGSGQADWYVAWGGVDCHDLALKGGYAYLAGVSEGQGISGRPFYIKPLDLRVSVKNLDLKLKDARLSFDELKFEYRDRGLKEGSYDQDVLLIRLKVGMNKPSDFCSLTFNEFPRLFRYYAVSVDEEMNKPQLSEFKGSGRKEDSYVVALGGPMINKELSWESYGVKFFSKGGHYAGFTFRGVDYVAEYGRRDYAVIIYDCDSMRVWVGGITRFGTRAGLLWLLRNPDYVAEKGLVLVKWEGNGVVEEWQVTRVYP